MDGHLAPLLWAALGCMLARTILRDVIDRDTTQAMRAATVQRTPKRKRAARKCQINVRLSAEEQRDLERVAEHESRTAADTVRVLIKRAAAALPTDP